ncbi:MAG: PmoA family protein, partial [Verrucomicrobia bacterium]|nr:PmoA family protein [Verrucomicrobiota bacterium]
RGAWAELCGKFGAAPQLSGIVVLQHSANPDYPGEWVKFPELNWFQPTFPASGTRYGLKPGEPLDLRFRLWLHRGGVAGVENCTAHWRAYQVFPATSDRPYR